MSDVLVRPDASSGGSRSVAVRGGDASSNTASSGGGPVSVPRDQLYYWTQKWQRDESEARRDYAEGRVHEFEDIREAARWLLDPSD